MNSGRSNSHACPVCKSAFTQDNLIPLYGRGKESNDPRKKAPEHKPTGHRADPPPQSQPQHAQNVNPFGLFGFGGGNGGWSFNAGFGPFGIPMFSFGMGFPRQRTVYVDNSATDNNAGRYTNANDTNRTPEEARREQLARILFSVLVIALFLLPFFSN